MSKDSSLHLLLITLRSPFARRVRLAVRRIGLTCEERVEDVFKPTPFLFDANPLGLIPSLRIPSGVFISDSSMILEYLHESQGSEAGPGRKIWPADPRNRPAVRRASVWAAGIMTATVQWYLESIRPDEERSQVWLEEHRENIERTLKQAQAESLEPWMAAGQPTQAGWDLAVALDYLSLRMPVVEWRRIAPKLEPVLALCQSSPAFRETAPPAS